MRKVFSQVSAAQLFVAAVLVPVGVTSAGVLTADAAFATGCAQLVRNYQAGDSWSDNMADVRNNCDHTISARPVVNYWPDPNCAPIGAHKTRAFRISGFAGPTADGATEC
jgi:hypothetical protein